MCVIFMAAAAASASSMPPAAPAVPKFAKGERVYWQHLPGKYRTGEVVDIDGTIGVKVDDGDGVVYVEPRVLHHELTKGEINVICGLALTWFVIVFSVVGYLIATAH